MAPRFEQAYKIKKGADLGKPDFWNRILRDLDLRLAAREADVVKLDNKVDELEAVALQRINDDLGPMVAQAVALLQNIGIAFTGRSDDERTIDGSDTTFTLTPETRASFVSTGYVNIFAETMNSAGMLCIVTGYNRDTGVLSVSPLTLRQEGTTWDDWIIVASPEPTFLTGPGDIGAYTTGEVDALIAPLAATSYVDAQIATLLGGVPSAALDTITELGTALAADEGQIATILTALTNRVRVDVAQGLTVAQQKQARDNIFQQTAVGDANFNFLATDKQVAITAAYTAPRTGTLPAANTLKAGTVIMLVDRAGAVGETNTLTLARTGADTINGTAGNVVINFPFRHMFIESDGVSAWTWTSPGRAVRYDNATQGLSTTQQRNARTNIYASPLDAMALQGMQMNGDLVVSQDIGIATQAGLTGTGTVKLQDGWQVDYSTTATFNLAPQPGTNNPAPGFPTYNRFVGVTQAAPQAGHYAIIKNVMEGYRTRRLLLGTASAQAFTVCLMVRYNGTGTFSLVVHNSVNGRTYVAPFTVNAANTWELKTITIPGDTGGAAYNDNSGIGLQVSVSLTAGTSMQTTANAWQAGLFYGAAGQTQLVNVAGALFDVTGLFIVPGSDAPSQANLPMFMRPYPEVFHEALRLFYRVPVTGVNDRLFHGHAFNTTNGFYWAYFPRPMRVVPTLSFSAAGHFSGTTGSDSPSAMTTLSATMLSTMKAVLNGGGMTGMTTGQSSHMLANNASSAMAFDARL